MSERKLESRIIIVPNAGQFLVDYVKENSQDYAREPRLGFGADIQQRPVKSDYSGSDAIGFMANNVGKKTPIKESNEFEIWQQDVKDYIKQGLGLNQSDGPYRDTKIGFGTETEKPSRYDIKVTPINHVILPTKPQKL